MSMSDLYGLVDQSELDRGGSSGRRVNNNNNNNNESNEDLEQQEKYEAIISLLLAAGYFRARISKLSPFDRVIGGLSWCITNTQYDVDIDLFFQENANIGLQIKLGEAIEKTLARMKCPFPLQSHQIRGLDYISIHPVIQWLVKRVIEVREETGDLLRVFSEWHFGKGYTLPSDRDFLDRKEPAVGYIRNVAYRYRPTRVLRRKGGWLLESFNEEEEDKVQSTLLEYGHKSYRAMSAKDGKKKKKETDPRKAKLLQVLGGASSTHIDEKFEDEEKKLKNKMNNMEQTEDDESFDISGNKVKGLVGVEGLADIERMNEELQSQKDDQNKEMPKKGKAFEQQQHERQVQNLEKKIEQHKEFLTSLAVPYKTKKSELREVLLKLQEKQQINNDREEEMNEFEAQITDENREDVETLRSLVYLNENLKKQEELFRENCKKQLQYYKNKLKDVQLLESEDVGESERSILIKKTYEKDLQRLTKYKQALGKKIRDIKMVERKIDEIPSRSELQQYQLQFIELYEQVAAKLNETRKYYQSYNTLEDSRTFLSKEISILNSIHDQYGIAMKSDKTKTVLLSQFKSIIQNVDSSIDKKKSSLDDEKQKLYESNERYLQLVEQERTYHKAAKEFEEECAKNEKLMAYVS